MYKYNKYKYKYMLKKQLGSGTLEGYVDNKCECVICIGNIKFNEDNIIILSCNGHNHKHNHVYHYDCIYDMIHTENNKNPPRYISYIQCPECRNPVENYTMNYLPNSPIYPISGINIDKNYLDDDRWSVVNPDDDRWSVVNPDDDRGSVVNSNDDIDQILYILLNNDSNVRGAFFSTIDNIQLYINNLFSNIHELRNNYDNYNNNIRDIIDQINIYLERDIYNYENLINIIMILFTYYNDMNIINDNTIIRNLVNLVDEFIIAIRAFDFSNYGYVNY
jgi:hypothetical protein